MEEQDRVAVMQQFGRTYRAFMSAFEAHVGHPLPRWRILLALHEQAGESSQKRLVERLRVDPGALTRQLKTLEGMGWIARSMDTRDNRVTNVRLTEAAGNIPKTACQQACPAGAIVFGDEIGRAHV